jgi:hypothetical protein
VCRYRSAGLEPWQARSGDQAEPQANKALQDGAMTTVWIYVDTNEEVGDRDHLKVFANPAAADEWFKDNDPEGVAFEYEDVDLDRGIFRRKPDDKKETSKRQPTVPIPPRLLAHMRRWGGSASASIR